MNEQSKEDRESPLGWPGVVVVIAFFMMIGSLMYFDYSCSCQGCTDYSCTSPSDRKAEQ